MPIAVVVAAAIVSIVGVGVGFGLQRALSTDDPARVDGAIVTPASSVPVHPCPDDPAVDELHPGDRVLVTGVLTDDPSWLRIRDPRDPAVALWLRAPTVAPDGDVGTLPEVECAETFVTAAPGPEESPSPGEPSPSPSPGVSPTPRPSSSPTPAPDRPTDDPTPDPTDDPTPDPAEDPTEDPTPGPTQDPTQDPDPSETPTPEPTVTPIAFGSFDSQHAAIHPQPANFSYNCKSPKTSVISVAVTHPSGIDSVTFQWTAAAKGPDPVAGQRSGDRWSTELGGFVDGEDDPGPIQVTVTATAGDGSTGSTTWSGVELLGCT